MSWHKLIEGGSPRKQSFIVSNEDSLRFSDKKLDVVNRNFEDSLNHLHLATPVKSGKQPVRPE
jgi:hypothetical protein